MENEKSITKTIAEIIKDNVSLNFSFFKFSVTVNDKRVIAKHTLQKYRSYKNDAKPFYKHITRKV